MQFKIMLCMVLFLLSLSSGVYIANAEPIEYEVEIIVEEFDTLNYQEESFNAYFWVILTSDDADFTIDTPILHFPNGIILDEFTEKRYTVIEPNKFVTKVQGEFDMIVDYHNYPFEQIGAPIAMQIYNKDISEVILKISPNQNENDVQTHGLVFVGSNEYVQNDVFYDGKTYSQMVVNTVWEHPAQSIFLKEIFPLLIIGAVAIFVIRFQPHNLDSKAGAAVGLLFALIAFHGLVIEDALPDLVYLTFEEKFMIVIYALIIYSLIEVSLQQRFSNGDENKIKKINKKMIVSLPFVIGIISAILYLI